MREIKLEYRGVTLYIQYSYQPYEAPERGPEAQYPGCGASAEVVSIVINGANVGELLEDQYEDIEEAIMNELSK